MCILRGIRVGERHEVKPREEILSLRVAADIGKERERGEISKRKKRCGKMISYM